MLNCWKCNFPESPDVRPMQRNYSFFGPLLVCQNCLKGGKLHFHAPIEALICCLYVAERYLSLFLSVSFLLIPWLLVPLHTLSGTVTKFTNCLCKSSVITAEHLHRHPHLPRSTSTTTHTCQGAPPPTPAKCTAGTGLRCEYDYWVNEIYVGRGRL